jgi:hypothetical protein
MPGSPHGGLGFYFANMRVGAGCCGNNVGPFAYPALLFACYHHHRVGGSLVRYGVPGLSFANIFKGQGLSVASVDALAPYSPKCLEAAF